MRIMNTFELNKIAGAFLLAGVIAMLASIVSKGVFEPHHSGDEHVWHAADHYPINTKTQLASQVNLDEEPGIDYDKPSFSELLSKADPTSGKKVFKKCSACHSINEGGANKVGPNLWNIIGKDVASTVGFGYSDAMVDFGGVWTIERLEAFLSDPKGYLPGTKMSFYGIRKDSKLADWVQYLISINGN